MVRLKSSRYISKTSKLEVLAGDSTSEWVEAATSAPNIPPATGTPTPIPTTIPFSWIRLNSGQSLLRDNISTQWGVIDLRVFRDSHDELAINKVKLMQFILGEG